MLSLLSVTDVVMNGAQRQSHLVGKTHGMMLGAVLLVEASKAVVAQVQAIVAAAVVIVSFRIGFRSCFLGLKGIVSLVIDIFTSILEMMMNLILLCNVRIQRGKSRSSGKNLVLHFDRIRGAARNAYDTLGNYNGAVIWAVVLIRSMV